MKIHWLHMALLGFLIAQGEPAVGQTRAEQGVSTRISKKNAKLREPITVEVILTNLSTANAPTPPKTNDFAIRLASMNPNRSHQESFINGVRTSRTDLIYTFIVQPLRIGVLDIPPFTVRVGRQVYRTQPIRVRVGRPDTEPILLSQIKADFDTLYVGQEADITLEILIRKYSEGGITLDAKSLWGLYDRRQSRFGIFGEVASVRTEERTRTDEDGIDHEYYVYVLEATVQPKAPGPIDLGDIEFAIRYPTRLGRGRFGRMSRDLFGRVSVAQDKWLSTRPDIPTITVEPIPRQGRPPDYSGAIGAYSIKARAAPRDVPVGDPITLTLSITGTGSLEQLRPPRLDQVEALTRDFEVSSESLAGQVRGNRKTFSQTIRALRDDVSEIPPIPYSFLNPDTGTFETVHSEAIAIAVTPAERLALPPTGAAGTATVLVPLVETTEGLLANRVDPDALLADHSGGLGMGSVLLLALMPAAYLLTWFVQRRVARLRNDEAWGRRSRALATARAALKKSDAATSPGQVADAILRYIADRCGVPAGGLTRGDAVRLLAENRVPAETSRRIDAILDTLEQAKYAQAVGDGSTNHATAARRLIDELERCKCL